MTTDGLRGGCGWRPQKWVVADAGGMDCQHIGTGLRLINTGNVVSRTFLTQKLESR